MTGKIESQYPRPDVPRLSRVERDRRWSRVRELMTRDGIDVLLAFNNSSSWDQGNGNGRYLSSVGGNCASVSVVFPRVGDVTVFAGPVPAPAYWLQFQDWVSDVRTAFFSATPAIIDHINELSLAAGTIGIAGLSGVAREPDGLVSTGVHTALLERLPRARLVNATALLYEARVVKSEEEIGMLRHAVTLAEAALDVLVTEAKAGISECTVYGRMVGHLIEQGSEPGSLLLMAVGDPLPPFVGTLPSKRRLATSDKILVEVDGKWCGYLGHVAMTHTVGSPDSIDLDMARVQYELTNACCKAMRPGQKLSDLISVCDRMTADTGFICSPVVHSRGLGLDAPVLVNRARDEWTANWVIERDSVFVVKPTVTSSDGRRKVMWGDTVVVRDSGAERLGTRQPPLIDLGQVTG
jgi:Xaa-Pro dipeptidase